VADADEREQQRELHREPAARQQVAQRLGVLRRVPVEEQRRQDARERARDRHQQRREQLAARD